MLGEISCEGTGKDKLNPDNMVQCAMPAFGVFVHVLDDNVVYNILN
jgi:hypothetical protein